MPESEALPGQVVAGGWQLRCGAASSAGGGAGELWELEEAENS